ncbi:uncharacterized protein K460DRAFT_432298 [Cucurbitaria berberidis CBS 394.84]|uniref:Ubiquitin-like protease family profile domain-containing protein n=1 Tax=Cucurbitaria berberidis CBS 394.84 TaxID=1168544 RepID=A0A9P4L602_9PLEO|nr:uncharacterized protein K460DRAFT_432298 [Cucurbitaria berberidis CBS 394.84]KAF1842857.1 hypothetical protein K460DRAFT_432298 [Cucurbitaria berberidis CBS 394.84]
MNTKTIERFPLAFLNPPLNDKTYLELGDAKITNEAFWYIGFTDSSQGPEAWMRGESLDMALETLRRDQDCNAYKIDIANSNSAQVFHFVSKVESEDGSGKDYDAYRNRYQDKQWIFVVINDAFGDVENDGTSGTHWSLVALDRLHKTVHYFDSLFVRYEDDQQTAHMVGWGLLRILGEDLDCWTFQPELNSPHQKHNNLDKGDIGPCGPFVYNLTKLQIMRIKHCQDTGMGKHCTLELPAQYPVWFGTSFNSKLVRGQIQLQIMRWRRRVDAERLANEQSQPAVQGEAAGSVDGPPTTPDIPRSSTHQRDVSGLDIESPVHGISDGEPSASRTAMSPRPESPDPSRNLDLYEDVE